MRPACYTPDCSHHFYCTHTLLKQEHTHTVSRTNTHTHTHVLGILPTGEYCLSIFKCGLKGLIIDENKSTFLTKLLWMWFIYLFTNNLLRVDLNLWKTTVQLYNYLIILSLSHTLTCKIDLHARGENKFLLLHDITELKLFCNSTFHIDQISRALLWHLFLKSLSHLHPLSTHIRSIPPQSGYHAVAISARSSWQIRSVGVNQEESAESCRGGGGWS